MTDSSWMCNMDEDRLMHAVMRSFRDADLRVELLPLHINPGVTQVNVGTGPTQHRCDATAQAVDGRYATMYKVHHCKVTPTSPPQITTEFPPQRRDLSPGCDNFQVGGTGSGETGNVPIRTSLYRGGMTWASRGAVYTPRATHTSDPFASSLRKYPQSFSPERSAEVLARLVNYSPGNRSPPPRSQCHSPTRHDSFNISYRNSKAYEESYAASCRPRAPDECPTRERRDDSLRKQGSAKHGDMKLIRDVSKRLRETLKSISSDTHTQTASACTDGRDREWYDTPIQETSGTENEHEPPSAAENSNCPVNTTVQAVTSTVSREVETVPLLTPPKRSIAVSPSPIYSYSKLTVRAHELPDPVTRSVQTFPLAGRSVETTTSSVELVKHDLIQVVSKKSKSTSDFRLNRDFKNEILSWLDDTCDPKIKEIQDMVLRNLTYRLKGTPVSEGDRIKVRIGNYLKSLVKTESNDRPINESYRKYGHRTCNQDAFRAEINSRPAAEQSDFEDVIKEWLNSIPIKKRDILLRPVKKDQIYNTFVNRLKHLVIKQSDDCREQSLRVEIMEILDEVPIEVNARDKTVYLERLTDALMCRLESIKRNHRETDTKPRNPMTNSKVSDKCYLNSKHFQPTEKETREFVVQKLVGVLKKQNVMNPELIKEIIINMVDILMDSVNYNVGLEEIASLLHNSTKLPENEAIKYATQLTEHWKVMVNEKCKNTAKINPFTVFMVQNVPGNYITKTSATNVSQHSIGSIVDKDIEANLHHYKIQLAKQIDRWLSSLEILQAHDKDFRQAVILDLANDIVDRQKYLEFNKIRGSDVDELEHLKYQIFKWVKRLIGEDKMETIDHASELMDMIRNIPVPLLNTSEYQLCKPNSVKNRKNDNYETGTSMTVTNDNVRKSNTGTYTRQESQNERIFTNLVLHNVSTNKPSDTRKIKLKRQSPSPPSRKSTTPNRSDTSVHNDSGSPRRSKSHRKSKKEQHKSSNDEAKGELVQVSDDTQNITEQSDNKNEAEQVQVESQPEQGPVPGPSELLTPNPPTTSRPSSAADKLMADWRPPPVFTPPAPGRLSVGQIHDEFQDYLKNWVQEIPISTDTPEEVKMAEKARMGILNGIWKIMTKIKTQPAVFQNNFYYEDVLGKEIDGLLDCLPQTQELKEKRYTLKAQLLEKTSNMNDMVKELQTPDNYKETVEQKVQEKKDEKLRNVVKLSDEDPSKMFEEMLMYCILDDFLSQMNYKETDKIKSSVYKNKLMKSIRAYMDKLKSTHGKEVEDILGVVKESDIFRMLYDVPLPTDDDVNENADEILLGLEVEQWMSNLPIVKNDDENEQRQRIRLRDFLTKNLYQMENGAPYTGDTQVKHEISFFLDKLPLEKDQDLRINEMVEELVNRLNTRHGGRRKSVGFQEGPHIQEQPGHSSRLVHRDQLTNVAPSGADRLYTTGDEWAAEEDDDAQYRALFRNEPVASSRIDQQGDEWPLEAGQDSQYGSLLRDKPPQSTMIEPHAGYGLDNSAAGLSESRRPYEQEPYHIYAPGQFHESPRGGAFGYMHTPRADGRSQMNESQMMSRNGPHSQRHFDSEGNIIPNVPLSDQNDRYMSLADARHMAPPMQASRHTAYAQPQSSDWDGQSEASGGFMSMAEHRSPRHTRSSSPRRFQANPNMTVREAAAPAGSALSGQGPFVSMENDPYPEPYTSGRRFVNGPPIASSPPHRSRIDPYMSRADPNMMVHEAAPPAGSALPGQGAFVSMETDPYHDTSGRRFANGPPKATSTPLRSRIDPNLSQADPNMMVHEAAPPAGSAVPGQGAFVSMETDPYHDTSGRRFANGPPKATSTPLRSRIDPNLPQADPNMMVHEAALPAGSALPGQGAFVSMETDPYHDTSGRRFANGQSKASSPPQRSRIDPNMSQAEPNMIVHEAAPPAGSALPGQGAFVSMETDPYHDTSGRRFTNGQSKASSPTHRSRIDSNMSQADPNVLVHEPNPPAASALSGQGAFVSMETDPYHNTSGRRFANGQSKASSPPHRSRIDPNMSQDGAAGLHSSRRNEQSLAEQGPPEVFVPDSSHFSRPPNMSRQNRDAMEPDVMQTDSHEMSVHGRSRPMNPEMVQGNADDQDAFVSIRSHQPPAEALAAPPTPLENSARNHLIRQSLNQPQRFRGENELESFVRPTDRANETANENQRTNRSSQNIQSSPRRTRQDSPNRSARNASMRQPSAADRLTAEASQGAPAISVQRSDRGLLASNVPSTQLGEPPFSSTPNQRPGNPPLLNIRERRQIEKERARRLAMDADEGEERCHCLERFKRWSRRGGAQCNTCDDCVDSGSPEYYPYPCPFMYPYPPFIRPPYLPHCRR